MVSLTLNLPYPGKTVNLQLSCIPEADFKGWLLNRQDCKSGLLLHSATKWHPATMTRFEPETGTVISSQPVPSPAGYDSVPYKAFVYDNQLYVVYHNPDSSCDLLLVKLSDGGYVETSIAISPTSTRVINGDLYDVEFTITSPGNLMTVKYIYYVVEYRYSHTQRYELPSGQLVDG